MRSPWVRNGGWRGSGAAPRDSARRRLTPTALPPAPDAALPLGPASTRSQVVTFLAGVKAFLFYLCTFTLALPLFVSMLILAPIVAVVDPVR